MKFILFDIDGTLIDSGGAGVKALNRAFHEIFSVGDAFRDVSMAGKTDLQIVREGMRIHGIHSENGVIPRFLGAYVRHLEDTIDSRRGQVKPGIREALDFLTSDTGYRLGLLTGNIREGARIKLEAFGLSSFFPTGAFGDDNEDRNRLLPIAVDKLQRECRVTIPFADCIVIGDTPRDIDCAKPYGAYAIAVATGPYSFGALAEAGADTVFEDLSDTGRFKTTLENFSAQRLRETGTAETAVPRLKNI